ncbi:hypothetical protein DFJ74DRAFT_701520 [Hyaloraphidium curvatum]|nr:hypothetical protein DFJ74DRAFT_701520 [Hyaloraphidium curvatum]
MLDAAKLLTFTLVAAFVTVAAALSVPQAVFERSCEACPEEAFCEFAFPGAASDEVACVSYPKNRRSALYKRYNDPPPFNCNIL